MSQISKCPKVTVVLTYWEASGDVSDLRYKSLLCFSSKRSYCNTCCNRNGHTLAYSISRLIVCPVPHLPPGSCPGMGRRSPNWLWEPKIGLIGKPDPADCPRSRIALSVPKCPDRMLGPPQAGCRTSDCDSRSVTLY